MSAFETISDRRSIRRFTDEPIGQDEITKILEAGRLAPSGSNAQPWKFLVIRSQEKKQQIADVCYGQKFIAKAPMVMVLLGCNNAYRKRLRRTKELVQTGAVEARADKRFAEGYKEHVVNDKNSTQTIISNCVIAGQNMILAAQEMGIGSCWVMLMEFEKLHNLLGLTESLFPVAVIPMGHPAQEPKSRPRYDLKDIAWDEEVGKSWEIEQLLSV